MKKLNIDIKQLIQEAITLPIEIGDTVLMGKFKNRKVVVKTISFNEKGDLLINDRTAMKMRLVKKQETDESVSEGKLTEIKKGDWIRSAYDELGLVNKVKGQAAYVSFDGSRSFQPMRVADLKKTKERYKGKAVFAEGKLTESVIGIQTKANFKPLQLKGALEKAGIKGFQMNRLSVTSTALKLDKKYFNDAKKIIANLGLSVMMAKEGKLTEAEDYKYKKQVGKAFKTINDAMFNFRNAMGVKQLGQADSKLKNKIEGLHQAIFNLQKEMKSKGLTEGIDEPETAEGMDESLNEGSKANRWFDNLKYYYEKGLSSPDLKDPAEKKAYTKLAKQFFSKLREGLDERLKKGESGCCHKCGHSHPKGGTHPTPYKTGKNSCASRKSESADILEYDVESAQDIREFQDFMTENYITESTIQEAEYEGRKVKLGKPMQGDVKKFKVYVKNAKGNTVKVNFGQKGMVIKKDNPGAKKSFRARHNCDSPGPRDKARYWSCRKW